jgi:hypothetical protein
MSFGPTVSTSPFVQGWNAREQGERRETCPYEIGSRLWVAWNEGFTLNEHETERREPRNVVDLRKVMRRGKE